MKVVIPVAGMGYRLRPHTHTQPKPLIPVAGKPILSHIIDNLIEAGIREFIFVVGYLKEKIQDYVQTHYQDKIDLSFVTQEPRRGLAHAIWSAAPLLQEEEEILIILGDTIFYSDTIAEVLKREGGILAVQVVDNPREFGIAILDESSHVKSLKEKPQIPISNLALVGLYKIPQVPKLLQSLDEMMEKPKSKQKEYDLTDALMLMIQKEVSFRSMSVENWFDCGRKQTLLQTNRILLERMESFPDYQYHNTVIIHPIHIAAGCKIENSVIGPYVAVAENTHICNSVIQNSILGAYSDLNSIILSSSVIGNDTSLKGKSNSISIGDNADIDFNQ
ncbi:MAG: sugar phosphate nucleotidyltransferase [Bacteroidota bacterium]